MVEPSLSNWGGASDKSITPPFILSYRSRRASSDEVSHLAPPRA